MPTGSVAWWAHVPLGAKAGCAGLGRSPHHTDALKLSWWFTSVSSSADSCLADVYTAGAPHGGSKHRGGRVCLLQYPDLVDWERLAESWAQHADSRGAELGAACVEDKYVTVDSRVDEVGDHE